MSISYRTAGTVPAALAALAAITAIPAGAAVVTVTVNTPVAAGTYYTFDVNKDGNWDAEITHNYSLSGGGASVHAFGNVEKPVSAGTLIGANSFSTTPKAYMFGTTLDTSGTPGVAEYAIGDNLYLPFNFLNGDVANYGWLDLSIHNPNSTVPGVPVTAPYQVTVNGYGYDDTGAAVRAGAAATDATSVPEPSSLLLLAAGFAGFSAMRRKSRAAAFTA